MSNKLMVVQAEIIARLTTENEHLRAKLDVLAATVPLAAPKPEACACGGDRHVLSESLLSTEPCPDCTPAPVDRQYTKSGTGEVVASGKHPDDYLVPAPVEAQAEERVCRRCKKPVGIRCWFTPGRGGQTCDACHDAEQQQAEEHPRTAALRTAERQLTVIADAARSTQTEECKHAWRERGFAWACVHCGDTSVAAQSCQCVLPSPAMRCETCGLVIEAQAKEYAVEWEVSDGTIDGSDHYTSIDEAVAALRQIVSPYKRLVIRLALRGDRSGK